MRDVVSERYLRSYLFFKILSIAFLIANIVTSGHELNEPVISWEQ